MYIYNNMNINMNVIKRNGASEKVSFDKVTNRVDKLCKKHPCLDNVNIIQISQKVIIQIADGVSTTQLDELAAQICSAAVTEHMDYGKLASRIIISNHQKNTSSSFSECISLLYENYTDTGLHNPLVSEEINKITSINKDQLNSCIDYERDFLIDYFGFKTLEKSYLFKKIIKSLKEFNICI